MLPRLFTFATGAAAGFALGLFVAATSDQMRAQLDAAGTVNEPAPPADETPAQAATRERVTAKMRAMGVDVGDQPSPVPR